MPKITRALQKIFAGDVPAQNNVAVFGSLKAGSPAYSDNPDTIQSLSAYGVGWTGATILNSAPALQDMNALQYLFSRQIAYILQTGVPEYLATETYYEGSIVSSGGNLYASKTNNNLGNAVTNLTYWKPISSNTTTITSVSTTYTILSSDYLIRATGSTSYTVTLPAAAANISGETHIIKSNLTSGNLTLAAAGSNTIDGSSSIVLSQYQSVTVVCDGSNWMIV